MAAALQCPAGALKSEFAYSVAASAEDHRSERLAMAFNGLDHGMARFQVNFLLGEGMFGEVFDVEDKALGGHYAMKTVKAVRSF